MIILSSSFILSATFDPDNPIIGWENAVTTDNVEAENEDVSFPARNLANPSTNLEWRAASGVGGLASQFITVTVDRVDPVDYVGIARHNFGSGLITVLVQGRANAGAAWTDLISERYLGDDAPVIFRFTPQSLYQVRIRLVPDEIAPRLAVIYVGALLVMERGIYVGHTPLRYGRRLDVLDGRAESGDFLGRTILGEYRESSAQFSLLDPDWYRSNMEPFVDAAGEVPFFFGWRPATYPAESGYAVLINDPQPVPTEPSHLLEVELMMRGVP